MFSFVKVCAHVFGGPCIYTFRRVFEICKMYPLKAATIKAYLHKILNDYVVNVRRSEHILGDNGTLVASTNWKKIIGRHGNRGHPSQPIRHPQATLSERCVTEIGRLCLSAALRHIKMARIIVALSRLAQQHDVGFSWLQPC